MARGPHAARKTISCGQPEFADTSTYVEFYETFTIFIKNQNFIKIFCFSSNYNCINSSKRTECEVQKLFVIWICSYLHTEKIFLLCNESVQPSTNIFLEMWPSMPKVCPPLH